MRRRTDKEIAHIKYLLTPYIYINGVCQNENEILELKKQYEKY